MEPFRVVCIVDKFDLHKGTHPHLKDSLIKGEIYKVIAVYDNNFFVSGYGYVLDGIPDAVYGSSNFRPVSDCGDVIAEYIEEVHFKEYQLNEVLK